MGRVVRIAQPLLLCVATLLTVAGTMRAQDALPSPEPPTPHVGIPEDWSTSHVIYTRNGSIKDMMKVRDDPRFLNNILQHYPRQRVSRTGQPATAGLSQENSGADTQVGPPRFPFKPPIRPTLPPRNTHSQVDWAVPLGSAGGMAAGQSPAKYSFNPNATPNCATDFAVYTINGAGNIGKQANLIGLNNLYVNGGTTGYCYTNSGTSYALTQVIVNTAKTFTLASVAAPVGTTAVYTGTITGGANNAYAGFVFVVSGFTDLANEGTFFCTGSTTTTLTLINSAAIAETANNGSTAVPSTAYTTYLSTSTAATWVGITTAITGFTNAGNNITVIPGTLMDPGYGFAVTTGTQVNETNAGTITFEYEAPTFLFSYAIQSGASTLSPVLSLDGTKIAWIDSETPAILHVTTWKAGEGTNATTGSVGIDVENGTCTAGESCDVTVNYTNTTTTGCTANADSNHNSNLYVDYGSGNGYVSADNGVLYQIAGIFSGNPTLTFCTAFTTTLNFDGKNIGSPVYDALNNTVYVSDGVKLYGYTVGATGFTPASTPSYTYASNGLSSTGPVLDAFNNFIYAFSNQDNQPVNKTSVTQIKTTLASGVNVNLGPQFGSNAVPLYYGAFDNNYYIHGPAYGSNPPSTLYTCGTDSTKTFNQDLFAVSFNATSGFANPTAVMSNNHNVNGDAPGGTSQATAVTCSPLSEFYDVTTTPGTDRLFVGSGTIGATTGPNLVQMWNIDTQLTNTSGSGGTMPTYTAEATGYLGGTSGITMDNISTDVGAESIYFGTESANANSTSITGGYNLTGIYTNGTTFPANGGMDGGGNAYSSNLLGATQTWNGTTFTFGTANQANAWANTNITLPAGSFSSLEILAAAVNGDQTAQTFTVNYTDGTTSKFTQSLSDWYYGPAGYPGESVAVTMPYENTSTGGERVHATYLFGYLFNINSGKTVKSLTLPANADVVVLAAALGSNCGANNYCAVKLTQGALQ